jgi:hypothetical protein
MHFMRKNEVHRAATIFEDNLGSSERLLTSPVPLFYSRHTARFLSVWLLLLPFGLYDSFGTTWNHIGMIPSTAAISVFLFGIEELATQLEEPFTILPMQAFCDKIYNWLNEIASWEPNDNGMFDNSLAPEYKEATFGAYGEVESAASGASSRVVYVSKSEAVLEPEAMPVAVEAMPVAVNGSHSSNRLSFTKIFR